MLNWLRSLLRPTPDTSLSPEEARALIGQGALLLDVRSAAERRAALIPGSRHIPLGELGSRAATLPPGRVIICQCASGQRSAAATRLLRAQGLDARNLRGGIGRWQAAGLPVERP